MSRSDFWRLQKQRISRGLYSRNYGTCLLTVSKCSQNFGFYFWKRKKKIAPVILFFGGYFDIFGGKSPFAIAYFDPWLLCSFAKTAFFSLRAMACLIISLIRFWSGWHHSKPSNMQGEIGNKVAYACAEVVYAYMCSWLVAMYMRARCQRGQLVNCPDVRPLLSSKDNVWFNQWNYYRMRLNGGRSSMERIASDNNNIPIVRNGKLDKFGQVDLNIYQC